MRLLLAGNFVLGTDLLVGNPFDGSGYGHLQLVLDQRNLLEVVLTQFNIGSCGK